MNDIQFWKDLCPNLTISESEYSVAPKLVDIQDVKRELLKDGYFKIPFDSWDLPIDEMAKCIEKIKSLDMHPVWCFVYDEFWLLTTRIDTLIKSVLGDYHKLPDFWAWCVDPAKEERGWKIHRDGGSNSMFDDGNLKALTIWIPLTKATKENGCICVVPIKNDPNFYNEGESFNQYQQEDFYDTTILEADVGDVLGWHPQLLHWGKETTNKTASPRISVSVEFVSDNVLKENDPSFLEEIKERPWLDPFCIPGLVKKAELINILIKQYQHMWDNK